MKLTKENILSLVSPYEILMHYLKPFSGGKLLRKNEHICSPLRDERTPSFCIYNKGNSQEWLWCDHGDGETGSPFDLVMRLHNCDFKESLSIINADMMLGLGNEDPDYVVPARVKMEPPKQAVPTEEKWFDIQVKEWEPESLRFWGEYGITKISLDLFGVVPVRSFSSVSAAGKAYTISDHRGPMFAYHINENTYKIYRPGQKKFKFLWLGEKPMEYVFGYDQLPAQGEIVFLSGGEKDVLTLHSWGYPAISLNSETATPSEDLLSDLKSRFDRVVVLYDNDKTGIKQAQKIKENTGLPFIKLPDFEGKDVSDWSKIRDTNTQLIEVLLADLEKEELAQESDISKSFGARSYKQHLEICEKLHLSPNPDFEEMRDGRIEVSYKEIDGKNYRIAAGKGNKKDAKRRIGNGNRINAVYLPPAIRKKKGAPKPDLIGTALFICQEEATAWLLAELGIPAVGLPRPDAFLSRPQHKDIHKLINQAMRALELQEVVYLLPHTAHQLAEGEPGVNNPYEFIDSASHSRDCIAVLGRLQEAFERIRVDVIYPDIVAGKIQHTELWLDEFLVSILGLQPQHWYRGIMSSVQAELYQPAQEDRIFTSFSVTTGTANTFRDQLYMNSVESFVEFHGIDQLGYVFQWGQNVYEYNRKDGSIDLSANSLDSYSVKEYNKRYFAQTKEGETPISDFTMEYELEVKQDDSFYIINFKPIRGASQYSVLHLSEILSSDKFKMKVGDIPGSKFNFWGSKLHIEQIHAMSRHGVKEAQSLNKTLGYDKNQEFYIYGNGILTQEEDFLEPDENGVVTIGDNNFYLPASAKQNESSKEFSHEKSFQFLESGIEFFDWVSLFIKVHSKVGHMALSFMFASLYRDIFKEEGYKIFPHFSIFALPDSGKTGMANSISSFFGNMQQTNLRAGVTIASFDRKIELYNNALILLNEFNLANPNVQKARLDEYLVGTYDYQAREKTVNGKTRQAIPNSSMMTIGQEQFWHREALASRCVIQVMTPFTRTMEAREAFNDLKAMESEGVSHFNRIFFSQRGLIRLHLREFVEKIYEYFKDKCDPLTTNRLLENWSMIVAPLIILIEKKVIRYPMTKKEILKYAIDCIEDASQRMLNEGVLNIFFSFIASEYGPRKLLSHQDVWVYSKENQLRIKLSTCHKAFESYLNRENFGIENKSKNDLLARLENHPAHLKTTKGIQVGWKMNQMGNIAYNGAAKATPACTGSKVVVLDYGKMDGFTLPEISWGDNEEAHEAVKLALQN